MSILNGTGAFGINWGGNSGGTPLNDNGGQIGFWDGIGNSFTGNKDWEREQIRLQQMMDYNTQMSNTAWQRGAEDMKKAGINPVLMATGGGSPASTPTVQGTTAAKANGVMALKGLFDSVAKLLPGK